MEVVDHLSGQILEAVVEVHHPCQEATEAVGEVEAHHPCQEEEEVVEGHLHQLSRLLQ